MCCLGPDPDPLAAGLLSLGMDLGSAHGLIVGEFLARGKMEMGTLYSSEFLGFQ